MSHCGILLSNVKKQNRGKPRRLAATADSVTSGALEEDRRPGGLNREEQWENNITTGVKSQIKESNEGFPCD